MGTVFYFKVNNNQLESTLGSTNPSDIFGEGYTIEDNYINIPTKRIWYNPFTNYDTGQMILINGIYPKASIKYGYKMKFKLKSSLYSANRPLNILIPLLDDIHALKFTHYSNDSIKIVLDCARQGYNYKLTDDNSDIFLDNKSEHTISFQYFLDIMTKDVKCIITINNNKYEKNMKHTYGNKRWIFTGTVKNYYTFYIVHGNNGWQIGNTSARIWAEGMFEYFKINNFYFITNIDKSTNSLVDIKDYGEFKKNNRIIETNWSNEYSPKNKIHIWN